MTEEIKIPGCYGWYDEPCRECGQCTWEVGCQQLTDRRGLPIVNDLQIDRVWHVGSEVDPSF